MTITPSNPSAFTRRQLLAALPASALAAWQPAAFAQTGIAPITALGVYALLGDAVQVTEPDPDHVANTRIQRTAKMALSVPNIGFDEIALRAVREALPKVLPSASLELYKSNKLLSNEEQRQIDRDARGGGLPDWIVRTIVDKKLSHVLLLTRARADVALRSTDGDTVGRGRVEGIGFYVDGEGDTYNKTDKIHSRGRLGPHILVQLTLLDTMSAESRSYLVNRQWLQGATTHGAGLHPWDSLKPAEKVELLRNSLRNNLERTVPDFLAGRI